MKRVLLVSAGDIAAGGVVGYILKLLEYIPDRSKYEFIWYAPGKVTDPKTMEQIEKLNVRLIVSDYNVQDPDVRKKWRFMHNEISKLIKSQKIDVIHVNTGNLLAQIHALAAAEENNVPIRIAHSHGGYPLSGNPLKRFYYSYLNNRVCSHATVKLTCSDIAAVSLFGKKGAENSVLIKNGIDTKRFVFSENIRMVKRKELGLKCDFIIGHVGTFDDNKNQILLINTLEKLEQRFPGKYGLVLIGNGYTFDKLNEYVTSKKMNNIVRFLGRRTDVNEWMSAFDCFALPSIREGLPFVCVEAQCAGLPCIISDSVSKEVGLTDLVSFLSIENNIENWANEIIKTADRSINRVQYAEDVKKVGFDVHDSVDKVLSFYR